MNTYHIRELPWTKEFLIIPGSRKKYSLHHLFVTVDDLPGAAESENGKAIQTVLLRHHRTNECLCRILVSAEERDDYRAFENQLLNSRLP